MKFKPAVSQTAYKKLAVFGGPGQGKSILALSAPGKKMVIDTEGGTLPYAGLTSFEVQHTHSFGDIKDAVDELSSNPPTEETSLIIDSGSLIWAGLQQAMLEKKMEEKGLKASMGTEKVQFVLADWGILKKWHNNIINTLLTLKCHVVVTFRESEGMDEITYKKTGVFSPQWEKNTAYAFDYVGRISDRGFTFTKGRMAEGSRLVDMVGKRITIPTVVEGKDLPLIWQALFGLSQAKPEAAHPVVAEKLENLQDDVDSLKIAHEIRSKILPKYGISNDDMELYIVNKTMKDGSPLAIKGEDGKVHLSNIKSEVLKWLVDVLEGEASRMALLKRIEELKK